MKYVCVTLWLEGVCTDDTNTDDNANDDDDAQQTKHDCIRLFG